MLERHEALKALRKAVSAVEELDEPDQVEPALDAVASALKPFFGDLPDAPKGWNVGAVPLDALLAYLASRRLVSRETARAASSLLERSSIERYDGALVEEGPEKVNLRNRDELFAGLESIYEELEAESENDDEGT
jgi:hypothetical protein